MVKDVTPSVMPEPGGAATFDVVVTVPAWSGESVRVTSLVDDVFGDITAVQGLVRSTTCVLPQTLPVGGAYSCSFVAQVSGTVETPHHDTVTVSGMGVISGAPVSDDDDAVVTFTREPEPGRIIVRKLTEPSGSQQQFSFTASYNANGFTLAHGGSNDSGDLAAGSYGVAESVPANWTLVSASCDDQSPVSAISLQAGETVTCTFVNRYVPPPGRIIVRKLTEPSGSQQQFSFTASYNANGFTLAHGGSNDSGDLAAGSYGVAESVPANWTLVSASCDDQSPVSAISLQAGETVTCTFVNRYVPPPGRIIVRKLTEPSGSQQQFSFTASYNANGFTLAHGGSNDSGDLAAGSYGVAESVPANWTLVSASCDDQSPVFAISLQAGETVTCTFVNRQAIPAIRIDKTAAPLEVYPGDTITYTYTVTNTGNVELVGIVVTDDRLGTIGTISSLGPGASVTLTRGVTAPSCGEPGTSDVPCGQAPPPLPGMVVECSAPCYLRNLATVSAFEPVSRTFVTDTDDACITILLAP